MIRAGTPAGDFPRPNVVSRIAPECAELVFDDLYYGKPLKEEFKENQDIPTFEIR